MGCVCTGGSSQSDYIGNAETFYPILLKDFEEFCVGVNVDSIIVEKYEGKNSQQWCFKNGKFRNRSGYIASKGGWLYRASSLRNGMKCTPEGWTIKFGNRVFTVMQQSFFKGAMGDASPILFKFSTGLGAPKQHSCLTLMPDYTVAITPYKQEQNQHWFWDGVNIRYANLENAVLCCQKVQGGARLQVQVADNVSRIGDNAEWECADGNLQILCDPNLKVVPGGFNQSLFLTQTRVGQKYRKECEWFFTIGPDGNHREKPAKLECSSVTATPSGCDSETYQTRGKRGKGKKMITKTRNFEVKNLISKKRVKYRNGFNSSNHYFTFYFRENVRPTTVLLNCGDDPFESMPAQMTLYRGQNTSSQNLVCTWNCERFREKWCETQYGVRDRSRAPSNYWTLQINRVHSGNKLGIGRIRFRGVNYSQAVEQPIENYGILGLHHYIEDPHNNALTKKKMYQKFLTGEDALEKVNSMKDWQKAGWT